MTRDRVRREMARTSFHGTTNLGVQRRMRAGTAHHVDTSTTMFSSTPGQGADPSALSLIDHIFLTHSHLDHVAIIPFMVIPSEGCAASLRSRFAVPATRDPAQSHLQLSIWPDFAQFRSEKPSFDAANQVGDTMSRCARSPRYRQTISAGGRLSGRFRQKSGFYRRRRPTILWAVVNKISNLKYLIIGTPFAIRKGNWQSFQAPLSEHARRRSPGLERSARSTPHLKPGEIS